MSAKTIPGVQQFRRAPAGNEGRPRVYKHSEPVAVSGDRQRGAGSPASALVSPRKARRRHADRPVPERRPPGGADFRPALVPSALRAVLGQRQRCVARILHRAARDPVRRVGRRVRGNVDRRPVRPPQRRASRPNEALRGGDGNRARDARVSHQSRARGPPGVVHPALRAAVRLPHGRLRLCRVPCAAGAAARAATRPLELPPPPGRQRRAAAPHSVVADLLPRLHDRAVDADAAHHRRGRARHGVPGRVRKVRHRRLRARRARDLREPPVRLGRRVQPHLAARVPVADPV
ncbi:hypothetical protein KL941_000029 [Ogataea angusta]|nr:hypothetical protein KL941_000029 [Ogataea angusta]